MKRFLGSLAVAATLFAGVTAPAQAVFVDTDSTFITLSGPSIIDFKFAGFSAGDTDELRFVLGNTLVFVNQTTPVGSTFSTGILGAGVYPLKLIDLTTPATWLSGPGSGNPDGQVHLKKTFTFADFNLGVPAPYSIPFGAYWYGWEDRPLPGPLSDFNDLVFSFDIRSGPNEIPEPSTYALMLAGLAMFGFMMRRRMN